MKGVDEAFFFLHGLILSLFILSAVKLKQTSAIIGLATFALFFANFFFQRRWLFFTLQATTGSHYITAFMLLFFFLCEREGKEKAIYTLGVVFFFCIFLLFSIQLHLLYIPAPCDSMEWAFRETFSDTIFIFAPSLIVLFPLQLVGLNLWEALRFRVALFPRILGLVSALQLIDTLAFIVTVESLSMNLILGIYLSKLFVLTFFLPVVAYFEKENNVSYNQ